MALDRGILGNQIREARTENRISQEQLAELVNITPAHLKHLESEHRKPSLEVLVSLMEVLHFSFDSLVFPVPTEREKRNQEIELLLRACSDQQLEIILDVTRSLLKHMS